MRIFSVLALAATALAVTIASPVGTADAASGYRYDGYRSSKHGQKYGYKYRSRRDRDHYAARAHNLDPAGDYKGYPDWARVALSPKFDNGRR